MRPLVAIVSLAFAALPALAQEWPARAVTLVNPFAAGSAVDVVSRVIMSKVGANTGKAFVVENRTGANGNIGTDFVAKSKPDGHTFLAGSPGSMAINPFFAKKLPYDAVNDFVPVSLLVTFPQVLIVPPGLPVQTLPELISYVKARPGQLNFASSGNGSTSHLVFELIKADAGLTITHVPFRGGAPATQAVIAGDVQMAVEGLPSLPGHLKSGKVRALAVTSQARAPALPNVPAVSETIKDFDASAWVIMFAPAGTPAPIVDRMSQELARALQDAEVKSRLAEIGATTVGSTPAEALSYHRRELAKFKRAVELSGAKEE